MPLKSRPKKSMKAIQRNLARIHNDLPAFFERRQARADLRHDWHRKQHAHYMHYEAQKLLEHNLRYFPAAARAEVHRRWAREAVHATIGQIYHGP